MKKTTWYLFAFLCTGVGLYPIIYFLIDPKFALLSTKSGALLDNPLYHAGFYSHIIAGGVALLSGWSQFSQTWRRRHLAWHRNLGKVYVGSSLVAALSGFCIAFFATGGWIAGLGFAILGLVYFFSTLKAWLFIYQKDIPSHEKWMIFSFAACFAAVTLRLWLPALTTAFKGDFLTAYRIVAWLCWMPNMLFAVWRVRRLG